MTKIATPDGRYRFEAGYLRLLIVKRDLFSRLWCVSDFTHQSSDVTCRNGSVFRKYATICGNNS